MYIALFLVIHPVNQHTQRAVAAGVRFDANREVVVVAPAEVLRFVADRRVHAVRQVRRGILAVRTAIEDVNPRQLEQRVEDT